MFELGSSLREARIRQGRSFADLEHATKIRAKYLRALEDEQYSTLPSLTYVRGFLRAYAHELGLDSQLYVDEFNSRYIQGEEGTPPFRSRRRKAPPQARRLASSAYLLALAAIVAVTILVLLAFARSPSKNVGGADMTSRTSTVATETSQRGQGHTVTLTITAVHGDSWLDVRSRSANGSEEMVFAGTLVRGHRQTFTARRLWLRVNALGNLALTLNNHTLSDFKYRPGPATLTISNAGVKLVKN